MTLHLGRRGYDLLYRTWAPWDRVGVRDGLRALVEQGEVTPRTHPRVVDLGCGTGANVAFLAAHGFEVTGIDFSGVALAAARARVRQEGVADRCRLVEADLTRPDLLSGEAGGFDLVVDASTLDDLDATGRALVAQHVARLARPRAVLMCWCFYAHRRELPAVSFAGPSRMTPGLEPGEEETLFGGAFTLARRQPQGRHEVLLELHRRARRHPPAVR